MVRYLDPEGHPERGEATSRRRDPAERLAKIRERNAALTGVTAIEAAREVALRQLDSRARSKEELRRAIHGKGFSPQIADEVLARLESVGLIDDDAYACAIVADRFRGTGKVGPVLAEEMRRKGLAETTITDAMSSLGPAELRERARELVAKKLRSMPAVSRDTAYRRLAGMLARKGYSPALSRDLIWDALDMRERNEGEMSE